MTDKDIAKHADDLLKLSKRALKLSADLTAKAEALLEHATPKTAKRKA